LQTITKCWQNWYATQSLVHTLKFAVKVLLISQPYLTCPEFDATNFWALIIDPGTTWFLTLPHELQVKNHEQVLSNIIDSPRQQSLALCCVFVLFCKELHNGFEHEWAKLWNTYRTGIAAESNLRFVVVENFIETKNLVSIF
jgi:hypothetical protein